ncbi:hypothetical protein HOP50_01g04060 [Chloropicon primus]|uniref:Uncharacterized protein n=1 Tax=Chloropicon primus TaxID=1764295 RepID=A0A5B8MF50_9CHLO|nr:hypothetical protein A3770_01p04180 [Chloropicon primus]UPQ97115.1 hypothetical protein HOP50_01g04060 [Chloropicon primus]|eukprot:QDZ17900.1 hypothetical protein A3770_01p04180 [Chloropicon primus]
MAAAGRWVGTLRSLSKSLSQPVRQEAAQVSLQKRHVGNLPVKPNAYVEDWAHKRENVELTFRFNAKTLAILGTAGILTPYVIYQACVTEFQTKQKVAGQPVKKYWGRDN